MASRKKLSEIELLPPEDDSGIKVEPKPVRKVVETKTVTYEAPPDDALKDDDDFDYENEPRQRKKATEKEERDKLRAQLQQHGVTPASDLRFSLFRYVDPNSTAKGNQADLESCGPFQTTKDDLLKGNHLEIARQFGPGRYYFSVYKGNTIVTNFDSRIAATPNSIRQNQNGQSMISMPDPQNPNVTIQMPAGQVPAYVDPLKQMRESFKMMKEMREAMGITEQQLNPQPQQSPEIQMAGFMLQDPDLKRKAIKSLFGSNGESSEKDVLTTVIENAEPIGKAIEGIIRQIFSNVQDMRGENNGQSPMVQAPRQNHQNSFASQSQAGQASYFDAQGQFVKANAGELQGLQSEMAGTSTAMEQAAPEDELLSRVLNLCKRKTPVKIAADQIISFANTVEENPAAMVPGYGLVRQYPIGSSVWPYVEMFVGMPTEGALAFVASSEGGKEVAELEHAKAWCEALQVELKPAIDGEGEQDGRQ